jgi:hypothetical protein
MMRVKALRSHAQSGSLVPKPQEVNQPSPSLSPTSFQMGELYTVCEESFIMASKGENAPDCQIFAKGRTPRFGLAFAWKIVLMVSGLLVLLCIFWKRCDYFTSITGSPIPTLPGASMAAKTPT